MLHTGVNSKRRGDSAVPTKVVFTLGTVHDAVSREDLRLLWHYLTIKVPFS